LKSVKGCFEFAQQFRNLRRERYGNEVMLGVERQVVQHGRIDRVVRRGEEQRQAVGFRAGHALRGDGAARAGHVLHNDVRLHLFTQLCGEKTRD
jgi:hypothetical protein